MALIRNTILECQVCGESAVLRSVVFQFFEDLVWMALFLSLQVFTNHVPAAPPTPVIKACPVWTACSIRDTPVDPVHLEPPGTERTVRILMR